MQFDKAIGIISTMFYGQSVIGSGAMLTLAYSGYLHGLIMVLTITMAMGIYLIHLGRELNEEHEHVSKKYKFVAQRVKVVNGNEIISRSYTNNPGNFDKWKCSRKVKCLSSLPR